MGPEEKGLLGMVSTANYNKLSFSFFFSILEKSFFFFYFSI